jgi:hypothetical protein
LQAILNRKTSRRNLIWTDPFWGSDGNDPNKIVPVTKTNEGISVRSLPFVAFNRFHHTASGLFQGVNRGMDEERGQERGAKDETGNINVARPETPVDPHDGETTDIEHGNGAESSDAANQMPKKYWKRLLEEKPDRHIELLLTFAITFFAAVQWITSWQNNRSTTAQTGQLITAANINSRAAQQIAAASLRNAAAAENFSASADSINTQMGEAVKKLTIQSERIEASRQSSIVESQKALQATIDNFHQDQRAWVGVAGNGHINGSIEEGSPLKVRIDFQNFGKTPAFNERGIAKILTHPNAVPLPSFDTYSVADASAPITLMPGVGTGVTIETSTPSAEGNVMVMDKTTIAAIDSGAVEVYLYGSQWYDDAFRKPHRTDFCLRYEPHVKGWGSCDRHNYAD